MRGFAAHPCLEKTSSEGIIKHMNASSVRKVAWLVDIALIAALVFVAMAVFGKGAGSANARIVVPSGPGNVQRRVLSNTDFDLITKSGAIVPPPVSPVNPKANQPQQPKISEVSQGFNFELIGTAIENKRGFAFFKDNATGVQVCKAVGASVGDGKVLEILGDKVLIERGGQQGYIWRQKPQNDLPALGAPGQPPRAAAPQPAAGPAAQQAQATPAETRPTANNKPDGESEEAAENEAVEGDSGDADSDAMVMSEKVYKNYLDNIGTYLNQISTRTHLGPDNAVDGIQLVTVPKDSEAYKRGLREGDVVKSIQGQPVQDVTAAIKMANDIIKNEDYVVDVVVERNGQEEILTYEIWPE